MRRVVWHETEQWTIQPRKVLPLTSYLTGQGGSSGIYGPMVAAQVGAYRVQNDIAGYIIWINGGSLPNLNLPPDHFSTTLPVSYPLTPPGSGELTYYIVVRSRDHYGLVSQNQKFYTITIDSSGALVLPPIDPPQRLVLARGMFGYGG